jgi:hypothetical protein
MFSYIPGVLVHADDRENESLHTDRLQRVFQSAQEVNLTLNEWKCHFRVKEINFLVKLNYFQHN